MSQYSLQNVIVTDGLWRKSLSAIRSLGKSGFPVNVMGETIFTTGFWSRYTRKRIFAPTAASNAEAFGKALLQAVTDFSGAIILPMEDPSLNWVSGHLKELLTAGAKVLISDETAIANAQNKATTLRLAKKVGLECPATWEITDAKTLLTQTHILGEGQYVAKPQTGTGSSGVIYKGLTTLESCTEYLKSYPSVLLQERIPREGKGRGVSLLFDQSGECVASFAHERLREYPNSGGPSTDRQSIHAPELVAQSIALLKNLSWRGIGMVEWKLDPRDGKAKLMEINPRFWGSLELAVRSGVDFPSLYARAALGEKIPPQTEYRVGERCRWMMPGEILRWMNEPRESRERLRDFVRGLPKNAEEWDLKDLDGFAASIICTVALAFNPYYWKYLRRG